MITIFVLSILFGIICLLGFLLLNTFIIGGVAFVFGIFILPIVVPIVLIILMTA